MKRSLAISLITLAALAGFHGLLFVWPPAQYSVYFNLARPLVYIGAAIGVFFLMGGRHATRSVKNNTFLICAIAAVLYLLFLFAGGLFGGFGANAMAPNATVVLRNLWAYGALFAAMEYLRLTMVRRVDNKHIVWFGILLSVVFAFVQADNIAFLFRGGNNSAETVAITFLPALTINFFLTYAAQNGTYLGLLVFRAAVSLVPYVLPVVPSIDKFLLVIMLCVTVIIGYVLLDKFRFDEAQKAIKVKQKYRWKGYIAPAVLLAVLVIFGLGVLPVKPLAVASPSMTGTLNKGDIVVIVKVTPEEAVARVKEFDVIEFNDGKRSIAHRVMEIRTDYAGETYYITKGDANEKNDTAPVYPNQVKGIAQFAVPYAGWPAVWLTELFR